MRSVIIMMFSLFIISCTSPKQKQGEEVRSYLEQVNKDFAQNKIDTANLRKTENAISAFVQKYPDDTLSSKYLYELGMLYHKQRRFKEAINVFDKVYREYPDSKQASNAVFLQGFLYANVLNDLPKAKEKYTLYLDRYEDVDPRITNDIKMELDNLGKSPDELLKEIQEKAKEDSARNS